MKKYLFFLVIGIFLAVKPLIHAGLPPTHDGEYHVIRFYEFDKALRDGDWYPRLAPDLNNGYGVPLFNYVYPFPNYVASFLHVFDISFIDAFKVNLLIATFVGAIFFFFWTRLFFGNLPALTAGIFYTFAPYRFVDIYVRGSVGEVWALAWFPAFLWAITNYINEKKIKYSVLAGIFFALTIFSHNILGLMFAFFGFTYVIYLLLINKSEKKIILFSFTSFFIGLCISAVFWIPALFETSLVKNLQLYNINEHFVEIYQLIIPSWGTGFSGGNLQNQMSFQIGVANLLAVLIGTFLIIRSKYNFFLVWFAVVVILMLPYSKIIWDTVPLINYFQFPWRFLSLIILLSAFIGGAVIYTLNNKKIKLIVASLFIFLSIVLSISYTQPAYYHYRDDSHYLTRDNFIHGTNSQGDMFNTIWINKKLPLKKDRVEILKGEGKIILQESKTSLVSFKTSANKELEIIANIAFFPGWKAYVDGEEALLAKTNDGLMKINVPKGEHSVVLRFNDTIIRQIGLLLSLLGIVISVLLIVKKKP